MKFNWLNTPEFTVFVLAAIGVILAVILGIFEKKWVREKRTDKFIVFALCFSAPFFLTIICWQLLLPGFAYGVLGITTDEGCLGLSMAVVWIPTIVGYLVGIGKNISLR